MSDTYIILMGSVIILWLLSKLPKRRLSQDDMELWVYTDKETGMEYLVTSTGGIYPRIDKDGAHKKRVPIEKLERN